MIPIEVGIPIAAFAATAITAEAAYIKYLVAQLVSFATELKTAAQVLQERKHLEDVITEQARQIKELRGQNDELRANFIIQTRKISSE